MTEQTPTPAPAPDASTEDPVALQAQQAPVTPAPEPVVETPVPAVAPTDSEALFAALADDFNRLAETGLSPVEGEGTDAPTTSPPQVEEPEQLAVQEGQQPAEVAPAALPPTPSPATEPVVPGPEAAGEAVVPPTAEPPQEPGAAPAPPVLSVEELQKQQAEQLEATKKLLRERYAAALSGDAFPDDQRELLANFAAGIYLDAYQQVMARVAQDAVPLIQQVVSAQTTSKSVQDAFFGEWTGLNKPEYMEDLKVAAQTMIEKFPNASQEELFQKVGAFICIARGLNPTEVRGTAPTMASPPPASPAVAAVPSPVQPMRNLGAQGAPVVEPEKEVTDGSAEFYEQLTSDYERASG